VQQVTSQSAIEMRRSERAEEGEACEPDASSGWSLV
jgi:hypothetical protein